ncbi:MAG: acylphosphatase [Gallionella sp.]|nr:acylphosphatase [Gallionella sp.]
MTTHAMPKKTLRLVIHGRVQGVFFRDSMKSEAQKLNVSGWVRNRNDGTVEAAVQGEPSAVDAIVRWAHHGPQQARVEMVDIAPDSGSYTGFEVIG